MSYEPQSDDHDHEEADTDDHEEADETIAKGKAGREDTVRAGVEAA